MTDNDLKITFLSGGTGTPKLLCGFRNFVSDENITIVGNTGDDEEFYGLLISPDIDTLLYLYSGKLDLEKFWGVKNDTFRVLDEVKAMGENTWFGLGDKDLALHLIRNNLLHQNKTYTEIVKEISIQLGIKAKILPMSNDKIRTVFYSKSNERLSFQEYTVKYKESHEISRVEYTGADTTTITPEVKEAIENTQVIIIGPSNPITSIGPILAIKEIFQELKKSTAKKIAISPIASGKSFSGPAAKLMKELNLEASVYGLAKLYQEIIDVIIISENDEQLIGKIEELGLKVIPTNISLKNEEERNNLTRIILNEAVKL
ncbi:MAG: 2-phospho-L-lactate transferase [Candidatus Thorarchaeota archaeon]